MSSCAISWVVHHLEPSGLALWPSWFARIRAQVQHAPGFVAVEAFRDVGDPNVRAVQLTMRTWEDLAAWRASPNKAPLLREIAVHSQRPYEARALERALPCSGVVPEHHP